MLAYGVTHTVNIGKWTDTFKAIKYNKLTRATTDGLQNVDINLITTKGAQHMSYVPLKAHTGISYGDNYWYNAEGQLWRGGGSSNNGADSGLASAASLSAWSFGIADISARLDYHGDIKEVTSAELKRILAS